MKQLKWKFLVDASFLTPPLPVGEPRLHETCAYSDIQARRFVAMRLAKKFSRFINRSQLVAIKDTSAMPIVPPPRRRKVSDDVQDHSCHPHILQLPLLEGINR